MDMATMKKALVNESSRTTKGMSLENVGIIGITRRGPSYVHLAILTNSWGNL